MNRKQIKTQDFLDYIDSYLSVKSDAKLSKEHFEAIKVDTLYAMFRLDDEVKENTTVMLHARTEDKSEILLFELQKGHNRILVNSSIKFKSRNIDKEYVPIEYQFDTQDEYDEAIRLLFDVFNRQCRSTQLNSDYEPIERSNVGILSYQDLKNANLI